MATKCILYHIWLCGDLDHWPLKVEFAESLDLPYTIKINVHQNLILENDENNNNQDGLITIIEQDSNIRIIDTEIPDLMLLRIFWKSENRFLKSEDFSINRLWFIGLIYLVVPALWLEYIL